MADLLNSVELRERCGDFLAERAHLDDRFDFGDIGFDGGNVGESMDAGVGSMFFMFTCNPAGGLLRDEAGCGGRDGKGCLDRNATS